MSSTRLSATTVETLALPMGKASQAIIVLEHRLITGSPETDELKVFFDMLSAVHKHSDFEQWEC